MEQFGIKYMKILDLNCTVIWCMMQRCMHIRKILSLKKKVPYMCLHMCTRLHAYVCVSCSSMWEHTAGQFINSFQSTKMLRIKLHMAPDRQLGIEPLTSHTQKGMLYIGPVLLKNIKKWGGGTNMLSCIWFLLIFRFIIRVDIYSSASDKRSNP